MPTPVHIQQRKIAISRLPQSAYGTATSAAASAFKELLLSDQNLAQKGVRTQDNSGYSTQNDFPTEQWLLSHDVSRQFEFDLASEPAGRILRGALGSIATSQPAAGTDPTVYRHVFVPQDPNTSRQLPAYSFLEQVGSAIDCLYPSGVFESLSFRGQGIDRIKAAFGLRGSGKRTNPSGVTWATHVSEVSGHKYFFNSVCEVKIADAGALTNEVNYSSQKRIESWTLDYTNNLLAEDGYRPGSTAFQTSGDVTSGAVRSECLFGSRAIRAGFVARVDAGSDEHLALQSQSDLDFKVILTGPTISNSYTHKLTIAAPLTRYETVDYGQQNGIVTLQIVPKLLWDTSADNIVTFTLDNTTASYAT